MNLLYIDIESTGLDHDHHEVVEIAGIIEVNGEIIDDFCFKCRPLTNNRSDEALDIIGYTWAELQDFPHPSEAIQKINSILRKHQLQDKIHLVGHNVSFDEKFFHNLWDTYKTDSVLDFNDVFSYRSIDTLSIAMFMHYCGRESIKYFGLEQLANKLKVNIEGRYHTAYYDAMVTRECFQAMSVL